MLEGSPCRCDGTISGLLRPASRSKAMEALLEYPPSDTDSQRAVLHTLVSERGEQ